ncbi:MAG: hypothetical protein HY872_06140 [Chloroflexi bacterium]|nr:hypothetical protein [Chloroflexota bacterium]
MIAFALVLVVTGAVLLILASPRKGGDVKIEQGEMKATFPEITGWAKIPTFVFGLACIGLGIWMGVSVFVQSLDLPTTAPTISAPTNTTSPTETPVPPIPTSTFMPSPIPTGTPTETPTAVSVPANVYWYNTRIAVKQGQQLEFTASGTWFSGIEPWTGPEGNSQEQCGAYPVPCGNLGALVGKVGDNGTPFKIGSFSIQATPADGILFLAMNDNTSPCSSDAQGSCYWDNIGSLQVTITVR